MQTKLTEGVNECNMSKFIFNIINLTTIVILIIIVYFFTTYILSIYFLKFKKTQFDFIKYIKNVCIPIIVIYLIYIELK